MKHPVKSVVFALLFSLCGLVANAQTNLVDKVAELDDVYSFYMPSYMLKGMSNLGGLDILKATPIPSGMLKKVKSMQFVIAGKKKVVKKAQKILKDLDNTKKYQVLFRSSSNKEEKVALYSYPAGYDTFNEMILLVNENDRQLIVVQFVGEFSMEDINDIEEELRDDSAVPAPSSYEEL